MEQAKARIEGMVDANAVGYLVDTMPVQGQSKVGLINAVANREVLPNRAFTGMWFRAHRKCCVFIV